MRPKPILLAAPLATLAAPAALATTLTTSLATFQAGTAGLPVSSTTTFPSFDPNALSITTNAIPITGGSLGLSNTALVTQGFSEFGQFPYDFTDGFSGEIFIPNDANGNNLSSETIAIGSGISALGFEVAPYGDAQPSVYTGAKGGPYTVTVTTNTGLSASAALPGGNTNTDLTASQFFGFYGGGVSSLTIAVTSATVSTTDPNGLAFGNFVAVPGPASSALLLGGALTVAARARRRSLA